jgi:ubiquinone/menaquinone biosynthesis C-methylase UbiE
VDIDQSALDKLKARLPEQTKNIETQLGKPNDPGLPGTTLDAVLISNAYHEMSDYKEVLAHLWRALKPRGRLAVIESIHQTRRQADRSEQVKHHELAPELVEEDLSAAGFRVLNRAEVSARSDNSVTFLVSAEPSNARRAR